MPDKESLYEALCRKRTLVKPSEINMGIQDLNNIVLPVSLDYIPLAGPVVQLNKKYNIVQEYYDVVLSYTDTINLFGQQYYRHIGDFTVYFLFLSLYSDKDKFRITEKTAENVIFRLKEINQHKILFIPHYFDLLNKRYSAYNYIFLLESIIDNYVILHSKYWNVVPRRRKNG